MGQAEEDRSKKIKKQRSGDKSRSLQRSAHPTFQGFTVHDPLVTSGLLGQVRVECGEQREVNW